MNKHLLLILSILSILLFSACDDSETIDDSWRTGNEAQFELITNNSQYTKLNSQAGSGFIMYKVIDTGTGTRSPYFNEKVKVKYTGWYKYDWSKPDTYTDVKGNFITNKIIFDTTSKNNIARTFEVKGVVDGFSTALQNMKVGDKWEVWIPWKLGYGANASSTIKGYTTLVFEIELVEIIDESY